MKDSVKRKIFRAVWYPAELEELVVGAGEIVPELRPVNGDEPCTYRQALYDGLAVLRGNLKQLRREKSWAPGKIRAR